MRWSRYEIEHMTNNMINKFSASLLIFIAFLIGGPIFVRMRLGYISYIVRVFILKVREQGAWEQHHWLFCDWTLRNLDLSQLFRVPIVVTCVHNVLLSISIVVRSAQEAFFKGILTGRPTIWTFWFWLHVRFEWFGTTICRRQTTEKKSPFMRRFQKWEKIRKEKMHLNIHIP